jgi:predicted aspartyl protease
VGITKSIVGCLFVGGLLFCARAACAQPEARPQSVVSALPFKLSSGFLIVVEGSIGSLNKLKFILDTGMTRSVVDRRIAEKLQLSLDPRQMFDFDRILNIQSAVFPQVQFGPVRAESLLMSVGKLADFSTLASHVDAVIGSDLLSLSDITIDYGAKRLLFRSAENALSDASLNSNPVSLTVELQVQDRPVRLLVDTGFPEILLFEDRVRRDIPELKIEDASDPFIIAGRLRAQRVTLPSVDPRITNAGLRVLLAQGPPDTVLPGVDGLLGTAALKARRVHMNFATKTLDWTE